MKNVITFQWRAAIGCGQLFAVFAAVSIAFDASAQSTAAPVAPGTEDTITLQEFTVTGSNIRRTEEETILPLTVFDRDDLDLRAVLTPAEIFEIIPQGGQTTLNESSTLGADARGDVGSISLRSLPSGTTLILLNGRRLPPHSISQNEGGTPSLSVNANVLPSAAIDRIELLRDGASAIYGSDASAGVVNTMLRRDYDKDEIKLRYGNSERSDLQELRATFSGGKKFNKGRSSLVYVVDVFTRERLATSARPYSADSDMRPLAPPPWNGVVVAGVAAGTTNPDIDFDNSSTSSRFGNFRVGVLNTTDNSFTGQRPVSNRGIVTTAPNPPTTTATLSTSGLFFFVPREEGGIGFKQATPIRDLGTKESDYYQNLNEFRTHFPYTERFNVYLSFDHRLTDRLTFFSDLVYYDSFSETRREPTAITDTTDNNVSMSKRNYYNPFGERFYHATGAANSDGSPRLVGTPLDILIVNHSNDETGPRVIDVETNMLRLVAGLRGAFKDTWEWESAVLYGTTETKDTEHNALRESKMREALDRPGTDAYNPLGFTFKIEGGLIKIDQPYKNPVAVLDFIREDFKRSGETELMSWDFRSNGDLFKLPGGMMKAAFGLEFRFESYIDFRPPYHGENPLNDPNPYLPKPVDPVTNKPDNDFIALSPNFNVDTDRTMFAGFVELLVPIIGRQNKVPLVRALELQLAGRFEDYSDFGNTTKPKYGVSWKIFDWMFARASYNESFRAPNLAQLFPGTLVRSVSGVSDPYRFDVTGLTTDGSRNRIAFRSGNENLRPEVSENKSVGLVVDVPGITGLSVSADYWELDQSDAFNIFGLTRILRDDRDLLQAETARQLAAGTPIGAVVLQTPTTYAGSSLSIRSPITQADIDAFAAYNLGRPVADQRGVVGRFARGLDDFFNLTGRNISGIDYSLQYRMPRTSFGRFTFKGEAAYLRKWEQQVLPGEPFDDDLGEDGITDFRFNASVTWRHKGWSSGLFANYIGGYEDSSAIVSSAAVRAALYPLDYVNPENNRYLVSSWITWNTYLAYEFKKGDGWLASSSIRVGSNNFLDRDPPLADESRGFSTGLHSPRGRTFYVEFKKSL